MTFREFLDDIYFYISNYGSRGVWLSLGQLNEGIMKRVGKYINFGTGCFEEEWDVFVILDACRHDVMQEVASTGNWEFLPERVPHKYSCASTSEEYVQKAFAESYDDEIERTALICGNLHPEKLREELKLDERFGDFTVAHLDWLDESYNVPPEEVTDRAIRFWRERPDEIDRMIVWYMQPHTPYRKWELSSNEIWTRLEAGELERSDVWRAYRDNLVWVLSEVEILLENLEADRVVISSDHGEAFGEFGCFRHPKYVPLPPLKKVPWIETTSQDKGTRDPAPPESAVKPWGSELEKHLEHLGYK